MRACHFRCVFSGLWELVVHLHPGVSSDHGGVRRVPALHPRNHLHRRPRQPQEGARLHGYVFPPQVHVQMGTCGVHGYVFPPHAHVQMGTCGIHGYVFPPHAHVQMGTCGVHGYVFPPHAHVQMGTCGGLKTKLTRTCAADRLKYS